MNGAPAGERGQLVSLQYLRAVAAIIVAVGHASQISPVYGRGNWFHDFPVGGAGVDIFFVISGFIMCFIYAGRPMSGIEFFKRRLARVGPAYWIVTVATTVAILLVPTLFRTAAVNVPLFLASIAFIAWPNPGHPGEALPVFLIGWTLNYEFFFYSLFALSIAVIPKRPWLGVTLTFAACWIAGFVLAPSNPIAQFYLNPLTAEFVAGMLVWQAFRKGLLRSPWLGFLCIAVGLAGLTWVNFHVAVDRADAARVLYWGIPGVFLVVGAICMDVSGRTVHSRTWKLLGDASYSIYLIHYLMLGVVRFIWGSLHLKNMFNDGLLMLFAVGTSLIAGVAFHVWVEKPATARARRLLG